MSTKTTQTTEKYAWEDVSSFFSKTSKLIINGNTMVVSYNHEEGKKPEHFAFSIIRGKEGDEDYNGNVVIQASISNGILNGQQNNDARQKGDGVLIDAVYDAIMSLTL